MVIQRCLSNERRLLRFLQFRTGDDVESQSGQGVLDHFSFITTSVSLGKSTFSDSKFKQSFRPAS